MKHVLAGALVLATSLSGAPALAQIDSREGIALQNQISELRQELQQLGSNPGPGISQPQPVPQEPFGGAPQAGGGNDTVSQLVVRVSALEEQVRQLQGRVDDLGNQLQRQNDQLSKQIGDLAFKLGQGGAAPAANAPADPGAPTLLPPDGETPAALPPIQAPIRPPLKPPVKRPPELALREGNAALARRDYAAASAAAQEVLAGHGPRTADAQLLLARSETGQHQYRQAAADFYSAYRGAPRSGQAPVALLGVANALLALNDPKDACQALAKLGAEFPKPSPSLNGGVLAARKRASCS